MGLTGIVRRSVSDARQQGPSGRHSRSRHNCCRSSTGCWMSQLRGRAGTTTPRPCSAVVRRATRRGAAAAADRQLRPSLRIKPANWLRCRCMAMPVGSAGDRHLLGNAGQFTERGEGGDQRVVAIRPTRRSYGFQGHRHRPQHRRRRLHRRLFPLFEQVDGSMSRRHGGVEPGATAICKRLVELMGGSSGWTTGPAPAAVLVQAQARGCRPASTDADARSVEAHRDRKPAPAPGRGWRASPGPRAPAGDPSRNRW